MPLSCDFVSPEVKDPGFMENLFTLRSDRRSRTAHPLMATLLTTAEAVYEWNLKQFQPVKRLSASEDDRIVCSNISHDGLTLV